MIKLSIITVTFNCKDTLQRTIDSVLDQNYENLEYIIVDGISTDGTLDIIQDNCQKAKGKIRYISEKDNGLYDAMNKGIEMATGDIIGIVNGDDYYTSNAFSIVTSIFENSTADIVYSDLLYTRGNTVDYKKPLIADHRKLVERMSVNHPTCFVNRKIYQKYGVFDTSFRIAADYEIMARFYKGGCIFQKANEVLAVMEMGGLSSNNRKSIEEKYKIHRMYSGRKNAELFRIRNTLLFYYRKAKKSRYE